MQSQMRASGRPIVAQGEGCRCWERSLDHSKRSVRILRTEGLEEVRSCDQVAEVDQYRDISANCQA
jgi:hypothetical protein